MKSKLTVVAPKEKKEKLPPDWVTIAEYVRRKDELVKKDDPLGAGPSRTTVCRKIDDKFIRAKKINGSLFIDWNRYKDLPFRQYFQMPVPRKRA